MTELLSPWHAFLLGVIQGLTEFLPISSSGHLALAEAFFRIPGGGVALAVLLHAGTLVAIFLVFRKGIFRLAGGLLQLPGALLKRTSPWPADALLAAKVIVAAIPGAFVGLFLDDYISAAFGQTQIIGALLLVTAMFLLATRWARPAEGDVSWRIAWLIGFAQAFAILPGISRSGATITAALFLGVARPQAAEFSFLAAMPLILGSLVLELPELIQSSQAGSGGSLMIGFLTSFVVGWVSLIWLVRLVQRGRLHWFSLYCAAVGMVGMFGFALP